MNLKEAFRYQNFLDKMMGNATSSIQRNSHCIKVTKNHLKSVANSEAEDIMGEEVETDDFFANDDVIRFITWLIDEKEKLTTAISVAKHKLNFDLDAAVETNKYRQRTHSAIRLMLGNTASKTTEQGRAYKFNAEGNQTPYYYDIEVIRTEAFNRENAKNTMRDFIKKADEVSSEIDEALITTEVDYTPVYDVNDTFDDVMESFLKSIE